jgi:hypothetical protein
MSIRSFIIILWLFAGACAQTNDKTSAGKTAPAVADTTQTEEKAVMCF